VSGIHAKIRAAYEAGVKEVLLPADNVKDTADLPQYVKEAVSLFPVNSLDQVIARALLAAPAVCDAGDAA
jgi:ATP-dependent Lon protease